MSPVYRVLTPSYIVFLTYLNHSYEDGSIDRRGRRISSFMGACPAHATVRCRGVGPMFMVIVAVCIGEWLLNHASTEAAYSFPRIQYPQQHLCRASVLHIDVCAEMMLLV